jgi:CheY-like chemotaxis protein
MDLSQGKNVPVNIAEEEVRAPNEDVQTGPAPTILLAEDDVDDTFMMSRACERSGIPHVLQVVTDGSMAIDYLLGKGVYADRVLYPLPDLIFMDIKMPMQNGFEVLNVIRARPDLKKIPVVMLSHSNLREDVDRAYQMGVRSFLWKIPDYGEFESAIHNILKYSLEERH